MNFPKISIVVPSYNQGGFLEETLLSILNQEYPNLELFVADGGSNDNSVDIIKKYENRIDWWVSEKDSGQSHAINKGFHRATGEIITWINSDDLLMPGTLHKVAAYFQGFGDEIGLIHGGITTFKNGEDYRSNWGYPNPCLERNLSGMAFSQPGAFFKKKYLDRVGGTLREDLHYGMDYDIFARLACVCYFAPVTDIFSKYRLHPNSKSMAEQDKFIGDWSSVFINLCKNFGWKDIVEDMKQTGFFDKKILDWYYEFPFKPEKKILDKANKDMILFYHYCYVLKSLYWSDKRKEARKWLRKLKKRYPYQWLKVEKGILPMMRKLALPEPVLILLKKAKKLL